MNIIFSCSEKQNSKKNLSYLKMSKWGTRKISGKSWEKNKSLNMFNSFGLNPGKTCRWYPWIVINEFCGISLFLGALVLVPVYTLCGGIIPGSFCHLQIQIPKDYFLLIPQPYLQPRTYSPDTGNLLCISTWISSKERKSNRFKAWLYYHHLL